ncbi:MAG: LamG domain-containing protein [Candidatus Hydrogenedentes bacterium]|nr:LamG domain-containing protein [Candidatus Hydrogenedentota bacterium]
MPVTKITDHEARAKARLPEQFKNKEVINAIVGAIGLEMQDLEDAIFPMFDLLDISIMIGAQLDGIGDILTEPRGGASDVDYRLALLDKAARITASGTPEQVIERFITLASPPAGVVYRDAFPAGYCIGADPLEHSDTQDGPPHSELPDITDPNLRGAWLNAAVAGTADDFSTAEDDMTAVGSPTFPDVGVELNGSAQYLRRAEANWRSGDSLGTIEAWVTRDATSSVFPAIFNSSDEAATFHFFSLIINDVTGTLQFNLRNGSGDPTRTTQGTIVIPIGVRTHIAMVSDGSNYFFYVNGVPDTLSQEEGSGEWLADVSFRDNVNIGALVRSSVIQEFDGTLDDVRYYSDVRTPAEILADANAGLLAQQINLTTGGLGTDNEFVGGFAMNVTRGEAREILSHDDDSVVPDGDLTSWVDADALQFYSEVDSGDILEAMVGASPTGVFVGLIDLFALEDGDLFLLEDDDTMYVTYDSSSL